MEIRQLITFAKIIELQSFSKAAQALGYSQSAVTVQIRLLEEELSVRLFDRIGKHTRLTPKGEEFRSFAYQILHEVEAAKHSLRTAETPSGTLHIGAIDTILAAKLPALLARFHALCPDAAVRITPGSPEALLDMMKKNQLDLIYILDDPRYSNEWHKALEVREEIIFVSTPQYLKKICAFESRNASSGGDGSWDGRCGVSGSKGSISAGGNGAFSSEDRALRSFRLEELLRHPFLLTEKDANYRLAFDRFIAARKHTLRPFLETSNTEVLLRTLEKVGGITLLPRYYAEAGIANGRLAAISVSDFHSVMYRQIFYHRDKWVTPEMQLFLQLVEEAERSE